MEIVPYTTHASNLEAALNAENRVYAATAKYIGSQVPEAPSQRQVVKPIPPKRRFDGDRPTPMDCIENPLDGCSFKEGLGMIGGILSLIIAPYYLIGTFLGFFEVSEDPGAFVIYSIFYAIVFISVVLAFFVRSYKAKVEVYDQDELQYNNELKTYQTKLKYYSLEIQKRDAEYQSDMEQYTKTKESFDRYITSITAKHEEAVSKLEKALSDLYAENVIFPKYRNLVAITAINEYLESGRCDKLEGADGAYNLYEMELRQNIIIGQLSSIVDNLEAIRNNQYSLYVELKRANETVEEIVSEMRDMNRDAKLRTFYDEVIALAETSPRYSFGVML